MSYEHAVGAFRERDVAQQAALVYRGATGIPAAALPDAMTQCDSSAGTAEAKAGFLPLARGTSNP